MSAAGPTRVGAHKLRTIVAREYLATVRTRAFLVAIVLMPLLIAASAAIPVFAEHHADADERTCIVVDRTGGHVVRRLRGAAEQRSAALANGESNGARFTVVAPPEADMQLDARELRERLSTRVLSGELFAFVEVDAAATDPAWSGEPFARYYSNTPTYLKLHQWLEREVERAVHVMRMEQAGVDVRAVERARVPVSLRMGALHDDTVQTPLDERPERNPLSDFGLPLVVAMLTFMAVMSAAGPLMQSVLEEKMHRVAEILLSSVPPFQLMLGKLLAACAVAYTLLFIYAGGGLLVAVRAGASDWIDPAVLAWGLLFQVIALLMYGSVFLAVGAACSDLKSSQSLMMPAVMTAVTPMMLLPLVLTNPNGTAATVASLVPFFTPVLMLLRVTIAPGAPLWQAILGVVLSAGTAVVCVWGAAKIFRVGMLTQGTTPRLAELWRWLRDD